MWLGYPAVAFVEMTLKKTKTLPPSLAGNTSALVSGKGFFCLSLTHAQALAGALPSRQALDWMVPRRWSFLLQMINCERRVLGNSVWLVCFYVPVNRWPTNRGDNMTNLSGLQISVKPTFISCCCSSEWSDWSPLPLQHKCMAQLTDSYSSRDEPDVLGVLWRW